MESSIVSLTYSEGGADYPDMPLLANKTAVCRFASGMALREIEIETRMGDGC